MCKLRDLFSKHLQTEYYSLIIFVKFSKIICEYVRILFSNILQTSFFIYKKFTNKLIA